MAIIENKDIESLYLKFRIIIRIERKFYSLLVIYFEAREIGV